jgi:hypothetical protein
VLEAQVKWEKLTVYHYLAILHIPNAIKAIRCFIHGLSSADAFCGGAALQNHDR